MKSKYFFTLLLFSLSFFAFAQNHLSALRADVEQEFAPFFHGVASGDPLTDRVIIWTRLTTTSTNPSLNWEVATDTSFNNIVQNGTTSTNENIDYTVKVDVAGLQPNTWYYYRFNYDGINSLTGRTRTAPVGNINNIRLAVVSCSNFQNGFFNVYRDIVNNNDVDVVLHLGDYIYEGGRGGILSNGDTTRLHTPTNEILSLSDYRIRHSQHKLDKDLRAIHQQFPFITVWDDHESTNDSYQNGAKNHNPNTEGDWEVRKNFSRQAYFEWMPIRDVNGTDSIIRRKISFGNLVDFIMIDTRLEGREPHNGTSNLDTNRTLLGVAQRNWLLNELSTSTAQWKIIGNQVMVAPLRLAGTAINEDQWDGYPAERSRLLNHISNNNIDNVVVLTGDIHTSWANDLAANESIYNPQTGAGSVAVEFVATSVTSPSGIPISVNASIIQSFNPHIKFADLTQKGYVLLDINAQRAQADWKFIDNILDRNFNTSIGASWLTNNGENHLTQATAPLMLRASPPVLAPEFPSLITGLNDADAPIIFSIFPNPFSQKIIIQYFIKKPESLSIKVSDINGKQVYLKKQAHTQSGLAKYEFELQNLLSGTYILSIEGKSFQYSKTIFKQ